MAQEDPTSEHKGQSERTGFRARELWPFAPIRHRLTRRRLRRVAEELQHEWRDEHENAEAALPDGERIYWPGFWLTELYAPSHAPALHKGVESLAPLGGGIFPNTDAGDWMRQARSWNGGFTHLGLFSQPGRFLGPSRSVDLPAQFMYVDIQLHQVASGVTVAVAHFVLAEDQRLALDGAMRETFESKTEPLGGARTGHRLITPTLQREDRIAEIRERYRQAARGWIRDKLPGQFTSLGEQGPPVWDLILTANEQLFAGDRNRIAGWRSALGFGGPSPRWVSDALPGLSLIQPPFRDRSAPAATFCGVETELLEMLEGKHRGEDAGGLPSYLNAHMTDILALWTLSKSLGAYDRRFSTLRDDLAAPRGWLRSGSQLGRLRREVMPFSFDLETLRAASENRAALAMPIRYSDADFREVTQRKRDDSKESAERTLISVLQASISEQGPATATQARQVTEGLRVQGELVLASTNIRLQWFVAGLTLVVGLAGVVVASGGG